MTARAAFLRALPDHGFAPPEADVAARVEDGAALPLTAHFAERRFEREVRRFASEFWSLAPPERTARWQELAARPVGPATTWLHELAAGLEVVPAPHTDPAAAELAALVRELFTLAPRTRPGQRLRWLTDEQTRMAAHGRAARTLLRDDLPLARLEPRLFDSLATGVLPVHLEGRAGTSGLEELGFGRRAKQRLVFWCVVLAACGYIYHLAVGGLGPNPRPGTPSAPSQATSQTFTTSEIQSFNNFEKNNRIGPAPYRYRDWVLADRPQPAGAP